MDISTSPVLTPPRTPWTSASSPRHTLHPLPPSAFEALAVGDLDLASSLTPPSLPALTQFVITPSNRGRWRRRLDSIAADARNAPWMTRLILFEADDKQGQSQSSSAIIVGRIGFHGKPDKRGVVEVGYEIDPVYWRRGHATAAMRIIVDLARAMEGINVLKATVAEENLISTRIVKGQGLERVGFQVHERRGPEIVYELKVQD
ncbi:putative N-acetyltransferase domain-containing protein [Seiridium cardinale]